MQFTLTERVPVTLRKETLASELGETLWRIYDQQLGRLQVEFPSPKTNNQWRLTATDWVGHVPLSPDVSLAIMPKIPLTNLFEMWEHAYGLKSFDLLTGMTSVSSLDTFYGQVAALLAERVLERGRKGLYRSYLPKEATLPYVRGQVRFERYRPTAQASLPCRYDEQTADIPDNQILAYTLGMIARSRRCCPVIQAKVRRACHLLSDMTISRPFTARDCIGRHYNRLNDDYRLLHGLCRFFLEQYSGPSHLSGDHLMAPFLVNMPRLYELFVAEWLTAQLPPPWRLLTQEAVSIGHEGLRFEIDLEVLDEHGTTRAILDTKYKTPDQPDTRDFSQVVTYARIKGCDQAALVYPTQLARPLDVHLRDIRVRTLTFDLSDDLEHAGQRFLESLLEMLHAPAPVSLSGNAYA
jgi:5-methylcytosine-specific restriction enzyme subunit McrC